MAHLDIDRTGSNCT